LFVMNLAVWFYHELLVFCSHQWLVVDAERRGARLGLKLLAKGFQKKKLVIEGDSQVVIREMKLAGMVG